MGKGTGKGTGKGECGGDCCNVDAFNTDEGKSAAKVGLCASIFEGIGLAVNMYPACCVCCWWTVLTGTSGLPLCVLILAGGIANFVGGIVSCCKKSMCGLITFVVTSWLSLLLRIIGLAVMGIMTAFVDNYCEENISTDDDYWNDDDVDDYYTRPDDDYYYNDNDDDMSTCEDATDHILGILSIATAILAIWLLVSLAGAVMGCRGVLKEPPESAESCKCPCGVQEPVASNKAETVAVVVGEAAVTKEPAV